MRVVSALFFLCVVSFFPILAVAAPVAVAVSIPPQKYFVERIGGDAATVAVMASKGQDPHAYEPTAARMERLAGTELYFTIGLPFERQWTPKFQSLNPSMHIVDLLAAIPRITDRPDLALRDTLPGKGRRRGDHDTHEHRYGLETDDPHAWLSPDDMAKTVPVIVKALAAQRPEHAAMFAQRGEELCKNLAALSTRIHDMLDTAKTKTFLTFHQSWGHYARNFGLREACVEFEGRDPGPKGMAMLMDFAKANGVKVIVTDSLTSRSSAEAIANHLGARVVYASPLAENWPEALLEFSHNLAAALSAPE